MASTFAEMLVFQDLDGGGRRIRKCKLSMLVPSKIEDTFATVFRQISMNRFEDKTAHRPPQPKAN